MHFRLSPFCHLGFSSRRIQNMAILSITIFATSRKMNYHQSNDYSFFNLLQKLLVNILKKNDNAILLLQKILKNALFFNPDFLQNFEKKSVEMKNKKKLPDSRKFSNLVLLNYYRSGMWLAARISGHG